MFDKNLKDKRESLRLSQQDVAILLGVSRVTYIKYEQDPDSLPLGKYEQLMAEFIRLGGIVTDRKIKSKGPDGDIDFDL
jgi:transcriptional regulator with XRE-family HTH domain